MWYALGLPFVQSSVDSVQVPTLPPDSRCVIKLSNKTTKLNGGAGQDIRPVSMRADLPMWRRHTAGQVTTIREYFESTYAMDPTTSFSVRPPELRRYDSLEDYSRFFVTDKLVNEYVVPDTLRNCPWISGIGRRVYLRISMIQEAAEWFRDNVAEGAPERALYESILVPLQEEVDQPGPEWTELFLRFVDVTKTKKAVAVFSMTSPENFSKFLYHLVLTRGRYESEVDLLTNSPDMWAVFHRAGLTPHPGRRPTMSSAITSATNSSTCRSPPAGEEWRLSESSTACNDSSSNGNTSCMSRRLRRQ